LPQLGHFFKNALGVCRLVGGASGGADKHKAPPIIPSIPPIAPIIRQ